MAHSNSSLNCFTNCMKKYEHQYILHTEPCKPVSPHLTFGVMAHEVLYKTGCSRDAGEEVDYTEHIPAEILYPELKKTFNVKTWFGYFKPILKDVEKIENRYIDELSHCGDVNIQRELKLKLTAEQLQELFPDVSLSQPLVGVIDLLLTTKTHAVIIDYKFSDSRKNQDNFDMDSQLQIYALLVHHLYDIPLHNIRYGYIDIPKTSMDTPTILTNGTLSRSKSQNITQDVYEAAIKAIHGDDSYYNCDVGGYYYDCWCALALNKYAYENIQYLNIDAFTNIIDDVLKAAMLIDTMIKNNYTFCKKYDAYSCKNCEFLNSCKHWLDVWLEV